MKQTAIMLSKQVKLCPESGFLATPSFARCGVKTASHRDSLRKEVCKHGKVYQGSDGSHRI